MDKEYIINQTAEYVKSEMIGEGSGHDWWHVFRVWNTAKQICKTEKADSFIVELAALLHDISDWKSNGDDSEKTKQVVRDWLMSVGVSDSVIGDIVEIVLSLSFKGSDAEKEMVTIEGKIVRDADRLDAIGAIGIGRTFVYGGSKGREMYNPEQKNELNLTSDAYKKNATPTINHFYDKLLLLKDLMLTKTAKEMAEGRHRYMEGFLEEFYKEWDGLR